MSDTVFVSDGGVSVGPGPASSAPSGLATVGSPGSRQPTPAPPRTFEAHEKQQWAQIEAAKGGTEEPSEPTPKTPIQQLKEAYFDGHHPRHEEATAYVNRRHMVESAVSEAKKDPRAVQEFSQALGSGFDTEDAAVAASVARSAGLVAKDVASLVLGFEVAARGLQAKSYDYDDGRQALEKAWGPSTDKNLETVNKWLTEHPALKHYIETAGLDNHPAAAIALYGYVTKQSNEHTRLQDLIKQQTALPRGDRAAFNKLQEEVTAGFARLYPGKITD